MTPTARYTLAGGYQAFNTVISGIHYCGDRDEKESITRAAITGKIENLLESGDYFDDRILASFSNRHYRKLNVGLVRDSHYTTAVFLLERDYIEYEELPVFKEGVLTMSGRVKNGATLEGPKDLDMVLGYHQPPKPLTVGQLVRVYSSTEGIRVAGIREPASEGRRWVDDEVTRLFYRCLTPYDDSLTSATPIESSDEASELRASAREACRKIQEDKTEGEERTFPWITASEWSVANGRFSVTADLGEVLLTHGGGIYTLSLWGIVDGEDVLISEYSIFHGVTPPTVYTPR